jgi:hypothetical protein
VKPLRLECGDDSKKSGVFELIPSLKHLNRKTLASALSDLGQIVEIL